MRTGAPGRPLHVAVIGAGFTGSMLAAALLGRAGARPVRVTLIDPRAPQGPGLAFGRARPVHLLNVPAGNMSARAEDPGHFLRWARAQSPGVGSGDFLPRVDYGRYLVETLSAAEAGSAATLVRAASAAVGIDGEDGAWSVRLLRGDAVGCDAAVLCVGNFPPRPLGALARGAGVRERLIDDPWGAAALDAAETGDDVLLVGSGLTMVDVALELAARGHTGRLLALSRRGLLPASHRTPTVQRVQPPFPVDPGWGGSALALLRQVRAVISRAERAGGDWRDTIASLRPITPALWRRMPVREQRRFLEHVRPYWDAARHRLAPRAAREIAALVDSGRLVLHAGRLGGIEAAGSRVRALYTPRGSTGSATLTVDRVVNCTGPETDVRRVEDPLLRSLLATGLIRPDPLGLGIDADEGGRAVDARGVPRDGLLVAGPLRRGQLWEITAVPELRAQVSDLAGVLLDARGGVGEVADRALEATVVPRARRAIGM